MGEVLVGREERAERDGEDDIADGWGWLCGVGFVLGTGVFGFDGK